MCKNSVCYTVKSFILVGMMFHVFFLLTIVNYVFVGNEVVGTFQCIRRTGFNFSLANIFLNLYIERKFISRKTF